MNITGTLIAKNSAINFISNIFIIFVGFFSIPFVIGGLGKERFGILSIAWVIFTYLFIFDFGLGKATTKFVAEYLGRGKYLYINKIVWTYVFVQIFLGILGSIFLIILTPLLTNKILNIPKLLINEANGVFYVLAISLPFSLITGSFRGVLEASQRYDIINIIKIPTSILNYLMPVIGVIFEFSLKNIMLMMLVIRILSLVIYILIDFFLFPNLRQIEKSLDLLPLLFSYGLWITISGLIELILIYSDRFFIGTLLSMTEVSYYTVPYEAISKLGIFSSSLTMALFPAFSTLDGSNNINKQSLLFSRSINFLILILGPMIVFIILFSENIMNIWLGNDFAQYSKTVLQILSIGVLFNSFSRVPYAFLQGIGKPKLIVKFHLIEIPFFFISYIIFIKMFGIIGAAFVWTLRVIIDSIIFYYYIFNDDDKFAMSFYENGTLNAILLFVVNIIVLFLINIFINLNNILMFILFFIFTLTFYWFNWKYVLSDNDHKIIYNLLKIIKL